MSKQEKLISAEKLKMWILQDDEAEAFMESEHSGEAFSSLCEAINSGKLDPDPVPTIKPGETRQLLHNTIDVMTEEQVQLVAESLGLEVVKDE